MKQKEKGSLTVEAAFVMPVVLICIMLVLEQGIVLYTSMVEAVQEQRSWEGLDPAKRFRELEWMGLAVPQACIGPSGFLSYEERIGGSNGG